MSFAGPMPSAHAEQGVGEAGAPPCRLPHRQRVRVAGAQSFQPLLHILLVSRAHVQGVSKCLTSYVRARLRMFAFLFVCVCDAGARV